MNTLVIVEHNNQSMHPATRHTVAAAKHFAGELVLLVAGYQCQAVAEEAATLEGVKAVLLVNDPSFEHQLAENMSQLVFELADKYTAILVSSSTYGKNMLPRTAALLDVAQVSDVTCIIDANTFEHPIYAGNAIETVRVLDEKILLSVRSTAFEATNTASNACPIEIINKSIALTKTVYLDSHLSQSARPELSQAKIIVSGGRALQSRENFKLIEDLADALGGAVGASRAAVDAGFVPNDYQVGQTGKVVAPALYIAIGISGAIQHLAGMKDSKIIVAINKDEDAPMMQIANYYLVGDLFDLVPKLLELLKKRS